MIVERAGCRLRARVSGDGPPVVLVQGVGVGLDGWRPQEDALVDRYRCLVYDNRGFGESQPVGEALTVDVMAEDALALADAAGFDRFHLVGHSMGGLVALRAAARAPARIRSLALLNTFGHGDVPNRLDGRIVWIGARSAIGPRRWRRHAFLEFVLPPDALAAADKDALAAQIAALFGHDLADRPAIAMPQLAAMRGVDGLRDAAALAAVPTWILAGAHDPIAPPWAAEVMKAALPHARLDVWVDASHGAPIQHAARVNAALAAHWAAADG